ncbi:ABEC1 enzyme, partial [Pteruthius melanotis]|nr:ABEC1 enzyme [Pteruthius melanotis]
SMYVAKRALREQFDPRWYPQETYLLCELKWGNSGTPWIHWVKNDDYTNRHAEEYFLQEIFELRSFNVCNITWYLSWSPCANCCYIIRDFLQRHPNVYIDICVARLYYSDREENRRGLKDLARLPRVTIDVMEIE